MRISIDQSKCTGHGRCYVLAPDLFGADDSGYGAVTREDVPEELRSQADAAQQNCPEHAVVLEED
ncbi:MAG TPA: ferredoxin [Acidimicrobiales bacterium]|nr:ferredoxin [Acidimicrobiales bacterium]